MEQAPRHPQQGNILYLYQQIDPRPRVTSKAGTPSRTPTRTLTGSPLSITPSDSLSGTSTPVGTEQVRIISAPFYNLGP